MFRTGPGRTGCRVTPLARDARRLGWGRGRSARYGRAHVESERAGRPGRLVAAIVVAWVQLSGEATAWGPQLLGMALLLAGMRERVGELGGELAAGPRSGGGFAVRARLPLTTARVRAA